MAKNNGELLAKMNGNDSGQKPKSAMQQISDYMNLPAIKAEIKSALGSNADPARLIRTAKTAINKNPKLLECSLPSLMSCIIQAAEEGLDFSLGQAWIVQYNVKKKLPGGGEQWVSEAQYQRGYQGLLKLVRNTGEISDIQAHPIYQKDKFFLRRGDNASFVHEPNFFEPSELIGFYCYGLTKDGQRHVEVMPLHEVEAIGQRSKSSKKDRDGNFLDFGGPWKTDFVEMGRKTVVKRACKYLPVSTEALERIRDDEEREFGDASVIELNLGDEKTTADGGAWPALDNNSPSPVPVQGDEAIPVPVKTGRKEVTTEQVVDQIPPGPGDAGNPDLYADFDVVPGDRA